MKLIDEALKVFAKKRIIEVFEKEVEIYAEQLNIPKKEILGYIRRDLNGKAPGSQEGKRVAEIFNERVKFYSIAYPLSEAVIKAVVKEHLG